jgi:short-subunit dehydrogenase
MTASKNQGTALVTGASSGIGALYANRLVRRGYALILLARHRERLEALAQRLTSEAGRTVDLVVADLNDRKDVGRVEAVLRSDASLTLWEAFEAAREALLPNLSHATPAERYTVKAHGVVAIAQHLGGTPGVPLAERPRPL